MQRVLPLLFVALFLSGCFAAPPEVSTADLCAGDPAGFFMGFWHGFILLVSFIASLFDPSIVVYEVCNSGGWYDFGFLLGASGSVGGSSSAARRQRST